MLRYFATRIEYLRGVNSSSKSPRREHKTWPTPSSPPRTKPSIYGLPIKTIFTPIAMALAISSAQQIRNRKGCQFCPQQLLFSQDSPRKLVHHPVPTTVIGYHYSLNAHFGGILLHPGLLGYLSTQLGHPNFHARKRCLPRP